MTDDLDILDPAPLAVRFRGEVLELRPLRIRDLPAFSRLIRPVIAEFIGDRHLEWADNDDLMVIDLIDLHGDAILQAAAIATGRPLEWIEETDDSAELVDLARGIVEVNRDFFIRAVLAAMRAQELARVPPTE